jgi:hypothetical protein
MVRWILSVLALFLLWAAYYVGPYVALYDLANAIRAHDVAAISERVNFRAVRISVARQLVEAYLVATGKTKEDASTSNLEAGLGTTIVDPLLAEYVTPGALADLLNGSARGRLAGQSPAAFSADFGSIRNAWQLFITSEPRGFRVLTFHAPLDKPKPEQFGLSFRFRPFTWRVTGLQLPAAVKQRLVQEMLKSSPPK